MASDRATRIGAGVAMLWLVTLVVFDMATPRPTFVLAPLFALAPLIACAVLPAQITAAIAAAAVTFAVASGWWDHTWGTAQQTLRILDVVLVSTAAVVLAAVRVRREKRLARVVKIAEVAQRAVLPKLPTRVGLVTAGARYESAAQDTVVGGDLFDCYYSQAQIRFLVGDVRGKGIGAVEQAARVIRAFRQAAARDASLTAVATDMSGYLEPFFDDEEFVTALLVDASDPTRLTVVNCGHPPPVLIRSDGFAQLVEAPPGLPLGLGDTYDSLTTPWEPGDRLLLYTDGLSEARDEHGEFLPMLPLAPLLSSGTIDEALDSLLDAVARHVPGAQLADDLAVVLLENVRCDSSAEGAAERAQNTSTAAK